MNIMKQKTIMITGSDGGIGTALVNHFNKIGYYTIGVDLTNNNKCDLNIVTDLYDVEQTCCKIKWAIVKNNIDRIDCLVNNAAIQIKSEFDETSYSDFSKTMDVNVMSPFFITQAIKEQLIDSSVINISSIHATQSKKNFMMYATSKGALNTLTQNMALELAPQISVVAIAPGAVDTAMLRDGLSVDSYNKLKEYHPTRHIGNPDKLAEFISSIIDNSHFLTGTTIEWDGGISKALNDPE